MTPELLITLFGHLTGIEKTELLLCFWKTLQEIVDPSKSKHTIQKNSAINLLNFLYEKGINKLKLIKKDLGSVIAENNLNFY